ncbi:SAC domain, partial [Dillenia turbinata]
MASDNEHQAWIDDAPGFKNSFLQKFKLYETRSNFYMIGWDKSRSFWRVLKIDRLEASELYIQEDPTTYSESECCDLLKRIHDGNRSTGGLKFVTTCYGIVGPSCSLGFIKFLGPYYMLLITKRRKIGAICGHTIYAVSKSKMIPVPHSTVRTDMANSKIENRYKKLLCSVDLTRDFYFSYSYHVMHSVQKNVCGNEIDQFLYDSMFVWNGFLTRAIRNHLKNTLWTVALVYGFFKQVKLSISDRDFKLTLIARRSRHYAGTRYLKRGVNENGYVANDVETEQIVFEENADGQPLQISSVVQNRGSIPLFWSQETSRLNIKPDIILSTKDRKYEATRVHFENLVKRYGNPIIILNLIKTRERKPRESILRAAFVNAIEFINRDLTEENRLRFLHWDLNKHSRNKGVNVLSLLGKVAANAVNLTGFFYCQMPNTRSDQLVNCSYYRKYEFGDCSIENLCNERDEAGNPESEIKNGDRHDRKDQLVKPLMLQKGVLRTNCIDCLDRTNVAQFACGLVALGHQLHALGFLDEPKIDLEAPLADDLMGIYERMGDTLALQYGGSAAHNKIFSERRGQWKAATQSQEFFRTIQRYYSNAYMDAEKQDAINVFLGHFQPEQGKPALWELDSDQHYNVGRRSPNLVDEDYRSFFKRSLSDGNILCESKTPESATGVTQQKVYNQPLPEKPQGGKKGLSESSPEISSCDNEISYSRFTPPMAKKQIFTDLQGDQCFHSDQICFIRAGDSFNYSNFLDFERLSSSGNSCEEETYERNDGSALNGYRSSLINSPTSGLSSENVLNGLAADMTRSASGSSSKGREQAGTPSAYTCLQSYDIIDEFTDSFVEW